MRSAYGWLLLGALASPAAAHVMSMSSGELSLQGGAAQLTFRLPVYEVEHLESPERALLDSFTIRAGGAVVERSAGECGQDGEDYACTASYPLEEGTAEVEVKCDLAESTVPNHVHVLKIETGEISEQKVFDYSFRRHEVRFRPPTMLELWASESGAGALRVALGPAQLLFLAALAVAARDRRELFVLLGALLLAQTATAVLLPSTGWRPPPRFVEAAGALTVAYLATESLLLPEARGRWMVAAGMGVFHGLYFALFLETAEMHAGRVLAGAGIAEAAILGVLVWPAWRLRKDFGDKLFTRVTAGALLAAGLVWFATILGR